jgi:hypothetical protein
MKPNREQDKTTQALKKKKTEPKPKLYFFSVISYRLLVSERGQQTTIKLL